ncbi:MAG: hypothetical protein GF398_00005 [Chitinivibrionales bacterium]|nr:hypothetical protein [Chitinivibrionales bacterium]
MKLSWCILPLICGIAVSAVDLPDTLSKKNGFVALSGQENYTPQTLFDYINGGAGVYLDAGAQACAVRLYRLGIEHGKEAEVACYEMASPLQAFGLFRHLHSGRKAVEGVGIQAMIRDRQVAFWKDRWYVEILDKSSEPVESSTFLEFAGIFADILEGSNSMPEQLSWFPEKQLKPGSKYYTEENFAARSFLNGVVWAEYENACTLFVVESKDPTAAKDVLDKIKESFSASDDTTGTGAVSERIVGMVHGEVLIGAIGACTREQKYDLIQACRNRKND